MKNFRESKITSAVRSTFPQALNASANYENNDGLGKTLVYPYYTQRSGSISLSSTVTSSMHNLLEKSPKIKANLGIRENTQEVTDFNLFLPPKDVWTGAVVPSKNGESNRYVGVISNL